MAQPSGLLETTDPSTNALALRLGQGVLEGLRQRQQTEMQQRQIAEQQRAQASQQAFSATNTDLAAARQLASLGYAVPEQRPAVESRLAPQRPALDASGADAAFGRAFQAGRQSDPLALQPSDAQRWQDTVFGMQPGAGVTSLPSPGPGGMPAPTRDEAVRPRATALASQFGVPADRVDALGAAIRTATPRPVAPPKPDHALEVARMREDAANWRLKYATDHAKPSSPGPQDPLYNQEVKATEKALADAFDRETAGYAQRLREVTDSVSANPDVKLGSIATGSARAAAAKTKAILLHDRAAAILDELGVPYDKGTTTTKKLDGPGAWARGMLGLEVPTEEVRTPGNAYAVLQKLATRKRDAATQAEFAKAADESARARVQAKAGVPQAAAPAPAPPTAPAAQPAAATAPPGVTFSIAGKGDANLAAAQQRMAQFVRSQNPKTPEEVSASNAEFARQFLDTDYDSKSPEEQHALRTRAGELQSFIDSQPQR